MSCLNSRSLSLPCCAGEALLLIPFMLPKTTISVDDCFIEGEEAGSLMDSGLHLDLRGGNETCSAAGEGIRVIKSILCRILLSSLVCGLTVGVLCINLGIFARRCSFSVCEGNAIAFASLPEM